MAESARKGFSEEVLSKNNESTCVVTGFLQFDVVYIITNRVPVCNIFDSKLKKPACRKKAGWWCSGASCQGIGFILDQQQIGNGAVGNQEAFRGQMPRAVLRFCSQTVLGASLQGILQGLEG